MSINSTDRTANRRIYTILCKEFGGTTANGTQGEQGPQGEQGETGLTGPTGLTGAQGPQGLTGATGPQGLTGATGAQGERGLTGLQGIQGERGLTGPQGETGLTGPQGLTGLQGIQGGNIAIVDSVNGSDSSGSVGVYPYATINEAYNDIVAGQSVWVLPGTYTLTGPIALKAYTSIVGLSLQTVKIQYTATTTTNLFTMDNYCSLENLDISFGSSTNADMSLNCVLFQGTTSKTSKLINCNITVNNASTTNTFITNITGVRFNGIEYTLIPTVAFTSIFGTNINIYSNGNGKKRGILIDNSNNTYIKNTNVYVDKPRETNSLGSYVGIETNDPNQAGTIQIRTSAIATVSPNSGELYTSSDILQTTPTTMTHNNINYLLSSGIQIGPGTDLINKTAGERGFFTYMYPTIIYYGLKGNIKDGVDSGYLWPGTMAVTNNLFPDPSNTTKPAYFRIQQNCLLLGMMGSLNIAPGTGRTISVSVRYTPAISPTSLTNTSFNIVFGETSIFETFYNGSLKLNAGDYIHVYVSYTGGNGNTGHDLTVQLDLF